MSRDALGLIETKGLVAAIIATDAASKAAAVVVTSAELTEAAYMTIRIEGELGAVQAAVDAGARAAQQVGELIAAHVIPRPDNNLNAIFPHSRYISKYHPGDDRPPLASIDRAPKPRTPIGSTGVASQTSSERPAVSAKVIPSATSLSRPVTSPKKPPQVLRGTDETRRPSVRPPAPQSPTEPVDVMRVTQAELDAMPVRKLRQFARSITGLPIKGRQISVANREEIIKAIKHVMKTD